MKQFFKKHPYLTVFGLCFILGFLIILPTMIMGHGVFYFIDDYNQQEIPFNIYFNKAIKSGKLLWDFHNDLGASFIGSYSFYNFFSPFAIVLWLFKSSTVPYLMGLMLALKFAVAGLTSFMFLNRFVKNKKYALLGSLFYAFSGFQFTNLIFYHFHDCVAFFPLLLYSLDRLIKEDKKGIFALSVALNLFTNYFFFIGQVVFVILYYLVLNITKHYQFSLKKFGQIAFESIVGVGLGCLVLLPSIYFVVSNPRLSSNWELSNMLLPSLANVLEIIRSLVFPNDSMTFHSAINMMNYSSVEAFLPLVGCVLYLTYLIKKPKDPFSILLIISFIFMLVPILNSSFFAFTPVYYARWFYMPILIMSLLSIKTLEEKLSIKSGLYSLGIMLLIFTILSFIYVKKGHVFSYQPILFMIISFILLVSITYLILIKRSKRFDFYLLLGTAIYIVLYGNYFCFYNRIMHNEDNQVIKKYEQMREILKDYPNTVRYNHDESCERNILYFADKMAITSWNSNIEGNAFRFYESIGIPRHVLTEIRPSELALQDFLSVQYIVSCQGINDEIKHNYDIIYNQDDIVIYENPNYLKLGIDYNTYILDTEFNKLSLDEKKAILKKTIVLTEEQALKYQDIVKPMIDKRISHITNNELTLTHNGFKAKVGVDKPTLLLYTFPYTEGFHATVNSREVTIENVDNGLMAIKLEAGENNIEFTYFPKGLDKGMVISGISLVTLGIYMLGKRRKK